MPGGVTDALVRALAATDHDDGPGQLRALVEAWRLVPSPALAELVHLVGARVDGARTALGGRTQAEGQQRWQTMARRADAVDVGALLAGVERTSSTFARERFRAMRTWPPDPRLVRALFGLVVSRPFVSERPIWTQIFALLRAHGDASLVPAIDELLLAPTSTTFDTYRAEQLRRLRATCSERPTVEAPTDVQVTIDTLSGRLGAAVARSAARTAEDFLAEIWLLPEADGPRQVFGDWLTEQGDPRGEFIALQMSPGRDPARVRRERALLKAHARDWLGPLEPAIARGELRFDRGFLATCTINWRGMLATPGLVEHPAWSTVREYRLEHHADRACDRWLDRMIALGARRV